VFALDEVNIMRCGCPSGRTLLFFGLLVFSWILVSAMAQEPPGAPPTTPEEGMADPKVPESPTPADAPSTPPGIIPADAEPSVDPPSEPSTPPADKKPTPEIPGMPPADEKPTPEIPGTPASDEEPAAETPEVPESTSDRYEIVPSESVQVDTKAARVITADFAVSQVKSGDEQICRAELLENADSQKKYPTRNFLITGMMPGVTQVTAWSNSAGVRPLTLQVEVSTPPSQISRVEQVLSIAYPDAELTVIPVPMSNLAIVKGKPPEGQDPSGITNLLTQMQTAVGLTFIPQIEGAMGMPGIPGMPSPGGIPGMPSPVPGIPGMPPPDSGIPGVPSSSSGIPGVPSSSSGIPGVP